MAQGAMPAALENNAIQGMVASFPFAGTPILRGTGVLWINGPSGELPADVLPSSSSAVLATAAYANANPAIVRRLRQAVSDIASLVQQDPTAAQRALAAAYSQLSPQEIDLAFSQQWRNWTKPVLTVADISRELKLLNASSKLPGLERIDPAAALLGNR
jgi:ABC-type nitrate/sulfonate/bicarbonate transport system substrate-binding protein